MSQESSFDHLDQLLDVGMQLLSKSAAVPAQEIAGAMADPAAQAAAAGAPPMMPPGAAPPGAVPPGAGGADPAAAGGMPAGADPMAMAAGGGMPGPLPPEMLPPSDPSQDPLVLLQQISKQMESSLKAQQQVRSIVASLADAMGVRIALNEVLGAGEDFVDANKLQAPTPLDSGEGSKKSSADTIIDSRRRPPAGFTAIDEQDADGHAVSASKHAQVIKTTPSFEDLDRNAAVALTLLHRR